MPPRRFIWILTVILALAPAARAGSMHADFLVQLNPEKTGLVTGWYDDDDGSRGYPQRTFIGELLSTFDGDEPGVRAVSSDLPSGTAKLPSSTSLFIDLLPMSIGSTTSNLFYWDGSGAVNFTLASVGTTFNAKASGGFNVTADGSATKVVDGDPFVKTDANGAIHKHPAYEIANGGTPAEGIYLVSFGFRMPGYDNALPTYLLMATEGFHDSPEAHAAFDWVDSNLAAVPEPGTMTIAAITMAGVWGFRRRGGKSARAK